MFSRCAMRLRFVVNHGKLTGFHVFPLQALICSSFVPLYSGVLPPKYRGVVSIKLSSCSRAYTLYAWTPHCMLSDFFAVHSWFLYLLHAVNCRRLCFWHRQAPKPLNGFVPNSHRRHVCSLARTSLKVKVNGQGHRGQKTAFVSPFGGLLAVYVW